MRMPYWVLKLLPMWSWLCPRCRREVKPNSHQCPSCGERFPFPLRVPPRCLKDQKALEDYVHKHIFPKISASQREYLTQFFTTIFSDGFESGDFSAWTEASGSVAVVSDQFHHGTYSMHVTGKGEAWKGFATQTTIFARIYVRLNAAMPDYTNWEIMNFRMDTTLICFMRIYHVEGTEYYLRIWRYYPYQDEAGSALITIAPEEWHCFEMKFVRDAVNGEYRAYYDGVEKFAETGIDTSGVSGCNRFSAGEQLATTVDYHVDCVVVADTYIGPELPAPKGTIAFHAKLANII